MKTLIIALNSKYIHSALAPWYLKAACRDEFGEVCVAEYTVNETIDTVLASIFRFKPDVAAFSCYIWNISHVMKLAVSLKKVLPKIVIVLGGPEVSYNASDILREHAFINFVLAGEGEVSFPKLLRYLGTLGCIEDKSNIQADSSVIAGSAIEWTVADVGCLEQIDGLAYRIRNDIITNPPALVQVLDNIPSPYTDEMISSLKNKIVYFEASRGCPFSCSYCLSSASEGTRYFSLERVFADLDKLVAAGVRQVKFVDRTFNAHKMRAIEIIRHIIELDKLASVGKNYELDSSMCEGNDCKTRGGLNCNFHFEVGADLFDEEMLQLLESAPKGLFQIEAGVQTTNEEALMAVCRKTNIGKLLSNIIRLHRRGNIHIHADLIAGLPYEDYSSFGRSFDMLYASKPHQLQLGFLKFLKGTKLRYTAENGGYQFNDFPPYEILSGRHITFDELIVLKGIAELVERYYNSGRFDFSLEYIISKCFKFPFRFYENFYYFQKKNGHMETHTGVRELYAIFNEFASTCLKEEERAVLRELLRLDFLASDNTGTLPGFLEERREPGFNERCFDFLRDLKHIENIMPEAAGMTAKQLFKKVCFEQFHISVGGDISAINNQDAWASSRQSLRPAPDAASVLLFNYMSRDKVTGKYPFYEVHI